MKYRTSNTDAIARRKTSTQTLIEIMLQDAFLSNYKIALGIIESLETTSEEDNKQLYAICKVAIKKQIYISEEGIPTFEDYPPIHARIIRLGNNWQNMNTPIIEKQPCILFFTDRPFDNAWLQGDENLDSVELSDYRAHNMSDALCLPIANNAPIVDEITFNNDVIIDGNLSVSGNLIVSGNITAAHIEAEDGFTGTKTGDGITVQFNKGICIG